MWCERPFPRPNSTSGGRVTPPAPGLRSRWPPGREDTGEEDTVMPAPVIVVTGVSRGIGRAIAEELQSRGAAVVGAARNVADVPATASLLPVAADVTQETGRKAILEAALAP